jgi:hypothetical protein
MSHSEAFIHRMEPAKQQKHESQLKHVKRFVLLLFLVVLIYGVFAIVVGIQAAAEITDGRDYLLKARESALELSFSEAQDHIAHASDLFEHAENRLVYLKPLSFAPFIGDTLSSATNLFIATSDIVDSFGSLLEISQDVMQLAGLSEDYLKDMQLGLEPSITFDELPSATKQSILERLSASSDDLEFVLERIHVIQDELSLFAADDFLLPVHGVATDMLVDLERIEEYLSMVSIATSVLPQIAGVGVEKVNLLLFLNNNEIRPGGGFIGSYGVLETLNGDISHLETVDVYTLDDAVEEDLETTAPAPLQRYNATTKWFFRDSNWSPDFAASSVKVIERFLDEVNLLDEQERETVPTAAWIDGVIGFTPTYAAELLRITGDIIVGGQTFTPENVADMLEYQVQIGYQSDGIPKQQRKEILADLVNATKSKLYALPAEQWGQILRVSEEALRNKQLMFYSTDQDVERLFTDVGWGGRVLPQTVDTQMVVDANLASLKSDPVVDRTITYQLGRSQTGEWVGRTTVRYDHMSDFDWKTTRYRTYTRLYVPFGSELVRVQGALLDDARNNPSGAAGPVDEFEDLGMSVFGAFISIEPLSTGELVFEYTLADEVVQSIMDDSYGLTVFKQLGAGDHALTLELDFDKNVTHAHPGEDDGRWGDDTYELNTILDQDLEFEISL